MEFPSREELIWDNFLINFLVLMCIVVGIVVLFNPTDHRPSGIEDGKFSVEGEEFNIESGIDYPEPEEELTFESDGWCIYHTPDGCVKRFDNRSAAREYIMTESYKEN